MARLFDTHSHLNAPQFAEDLETVLERARAAGVARIVIPGYDRDACERAVLLAETHAGLYAAVGYHPTDVRGLTDKDYDQLAEWAQRKQVVAIGEIGLDYHWDTTTKEEQDTAFRRQIRLAKELDLPIIIHDREAHADIVRILKEEGAKQVGGIMHCFSGSWEMAKDCMHMNFRISFGGPVTFKNAKRPQEVAKQVPADYLLIETDAPYLTPEPHRGKRNEPAYVAHVAEKIAALRGVDVEEICAVTWKNAEQLFRLENESTEE
jgi:TatD DNase family protein